MINRRTFLTTSAAFGVTLAGFPRELLSASAADTVITILHTNDTHSQIDPNKTYTIVTLDYLLRLNSGAYAILKEAKSDAPLNITLRDAVMNYVKSETAAGRPIRAAVDNRFVQVGPGPKSTEPPR